MSPWRQQPSARFDHLRRRKLSNGPCDCKGGFGIAISYFFIMLFCPSGLASHLKAAPFEKSGSKLFTGATNETSDLLPGRFVNWIAGAPGGRIALLLFPRLRHLPLGMLDINLVVSRGV